MNKVILTQKQADAIIRNENEGLGNSDILYRYLRFYGYDEQFRGLTFGALADALYIGYEVEPEFKVGDWVVHENGNPIRRVTGFSSNHLEVSDGEDEYIWSKPFVRHATPSEIAEEKERRFWKRHGRDVREVRSGDIIYSYSTGITFVRNDNARHVTDFDGFQVVCFAENRLDVRDDE